VTNDAVLPNDKAISPPPPSTAGMTTKVVKGSFWSLIGQIAPLAVTLVTTPFIIRMLGSEGYGVVVLVGLIPGYLTFADLGMGMASTKFGSEAYGKGDVAEEARVVRTAALIALLLSLPIAVLIFASSGWLVALLNVPSHLQADASLAIKFASVSLVFFLLNNIVNTPQLARLRMDLNTLVTAGARIAGLIAAPVIIYLGGGVAGAVAAFAMSNIATFFGHLFTSGRLNAELLHMSIDRRLIRPLLRFGGALAISSIAAVLLVNLEKIVLTKQTSVEVLAYYSVAFTFANAATLFSLSMGQSLMPAFAQLLTPDRRQELIGLFRRAVRISMFGLLPAMAVLAVIARPFFTIWAGPDFGRESTVPFFILLFGLFFNLNAYIPAGLILASGRTDLIAKLYWIEIVPYITITALLAGRYGAIGAAAAWSIRVIADAIIFFWLASRVCNVSAGIKTIVVRFVGGMVIVAPVFIGAIMFPGIPTLAALVILVPTISAYCILTWKTVIDVEEKKWVTIQAARLKSFSNAVHI
jgi:O-antigen/teichoic acid export membrane protein